MFYKVIARADDKYSRASQFILDIEDSLKERFAKKFSLADLKQLKEICLEMKDMLMDKKQGIPADNNKLAGFYKPLDRIYYRERKLDCEIRKIFSKLTEDKIDKSYKLFYEDLKDLNFYLFTILACFKRNLEALQWNLPHNVCYLADKLIEVWEEYQEYLNGRKIRPESVIIPQINGGV